MDEKEYVNSISNEQLVTSFQDRKMRLPSLFKKYFLFDRLCLFHLKKKR